MLSTNSSWLPHWFKKKKETEKPSKQTEKVGECGLYAQRDSSTCMVSATSAVPAFQFLPSSSATKAGWDSHLAAPVMLPIYSVVSTGWSEPWNALACIDNQSSASLSWGSNWSSLTNINWKYTLYVKNWVIIKPTVHYHGDGGATSYAGVLCADVCVVLTLPHHCSFSRLCDSALLTPPFGGLCALPAWICLLRLILSLLFSCTDFLFAWTCAPHLRFVWVSELPIFHQSPLVVPWHLHAAKVGFIFLCRGYSAFASRVSSI